MTLTLQGPDNTDLVNKKGPWSLILTQGVPNAAGPDAMELQLHAQDNGEMRGVLDLYQSNTQMYLTRVALLRKLRLRWAGALMT